MNGGRPPPKPVAPVEVQADWTVKVRVTFPEYPFRLWRVSVELVLDPIGAMRFVGFPVRL